MSRIFHHTIPDDTVFSPFLYGYYFYHIDPECSHMTLHGTPAFRICSIHSDSEKYKRRGVDIFDKFEN